MITVALAGIAVGLCLAGWIGAVRCEPADTDLAALVLSDHERWGR